MIEINKIIQLFTSHKPVMVLIFAVFIWIMPLHFAVKFVGGKTNILKSLSYSLLSAFLSLFSILLLSLVKVGEFGIVLGAIIIILLYSRKLLICSLQQ